VVYRDDDILIAYKPAGLSSMPAKEQRHFSMKASIEALVQRSIHMPSRLDVSAQGLLVTSISARAHARLQQAFESRQVTKRYLCASRQRPPWSETRVTLPIARDPRHPVLRIAHATDNLPRLFFASNVIRNQKALQCACILQNRSLDGLIRSGYTPHRKGSHCTGIVSTVANVLRTCTS
jgi:23S rRNA-/tRNA-specific pseudouridylate synthase